VPEGRARGQPRLRVTLPQILTAAPCAMHAITAEQLVHSGAKYCAGLPGSLWSAEYEARQDKPVPPLRVEVSYRVATGIQNEIHAYMDMGHFEVSFRPDLG
jgi:hypothetical protein